ncbi:MAG: DUF3365 domain-containing protein [Methylococcaceae bacterium]|nr:MAG: DUF3365 domain-containing protein [Methylococcaceae bacterium]
MSAKPPRDLRRSPRLPAAVLKRRNWWMLLVFWILIVALSLRSTLEDIHRHNLEVATTGARNMFQMIWLIRQWNANHAAIYAPVDSNTPPNPYLHHPRRDVVTTDGQKLTMINPAYMTRLIAEIAQKENNVVFHITSLAPIRPDNAADPWEQSALKEFEQNLSKEVSSLTPRANGMLFRYMAPLYVNQACLKCHVDQGYKVGDVRGGISVTQPFSPFEAAARPSRHKAIMQHLSVFLLVAGLGWWALEQLRRRWLELESKVIELRRARSELVQSETLAGLGRMVAGFAHEINTPVGVAVGAVSQGEEVLREIDALLQAEEVREEDLRAGLETVRQSSSLALSNLRRAADLVRSFKRTAIDQMTEQTREFDLRELIQDVLLALHGLLKHTPVEVRLDCPEGLQIRGVPGLYDQVLTNLVLNSVQHAFAEGTRAGHLQIAVSFDADGRLCLDISDDGAGMSQEIAAHLFEPFYTTRRARGGTGLGLYLCYNIITSKLGGTIQCSSEVEQGTRFHIVVPVERC